MPGLGAVVVSGREGPLHSMDILGSVLGLQYYFLHRDLVLFIIIIIIINPWTDKQFPGLVWFLRVTSKVSLPFWGL